MKLVKEIYALTSRLPADERFGLVSQLRRASVSVLANIAEGFSRVGSADKAYKYTIARGECSEVEALLIVTVELNQLQEREIRNAVEYARTTGRLLSGLIRSYSRSQLKSKSQPQPNP